MKTREEYAINAAEYYKSGYNCCQAVVLAFEDCLGLDSQTLLKVSSSFGGGMGKMGEVCGAVSGMFIVLGLLEGNTDNKNVEAKMAHYVKVRELANRFKEKNDGTIICRELCASRKKNCATIVSDCAEITYDWINKD